MCPSSLARCHLSPAGSNGVRYGRSVLLANGATGSSVSDATVSLSSGRGGNSDGTIGGAGDDSKVSRAVLLALLSEATQHWLAVTAAIASVRSRTQSSSSRCSQHCCRATSTAAIPGSAIINTFGVSLKALSDVMELSSENFCGDACSAPPSNWIMVVVAEQLLQVDASAEHELGQRGQRCGDLHGMVTAH